MHLAHIHLERSAPSTSDSFSHFSHSDQNTRNNNDLHQMRCFCNLPVLNWSGCINAHKYSAGKRTEDLSLLCNTFYEELEHVNDFLCGLRSVPSPF